MGDRSPIFRVTNQADMENLNNLNLEINSTLSSGVSESNLDISDTNTNFDQIKEVMEDESEIKGMTEEEAAWLFSEAYLQELEDL